MPHRYKPSLQTLPAVLFRELCWPTAMPLVPRTVSEAMNNKTDLLIPATLGPRPFECQLNGRDLMEIRLETMCMEPDQCLSPPTARRCHGMNP